MFGSVEPSDPAQSSERSQLLDRTKIIATLGPASSDVEVMRRLIGAGADCFRVNFSHGEGKTLQPLMDKARSAAEIEGVPVALLADIQGPKLRIGRVPESGVALVQGAAFMLTPRQIEGSAEAVQCRHAGLAGDVEPGARVLLADGAIELVVESTDGEDVHCRVVTGGRLFSNKGLNLPNRQVSVETLTEKDRADLNYLAETDVDLIAVSFVRTAGDLYLARRILGPTPKIPLIAKLERYEALENLDAILSASDGIMVARGDLGVELPFERVPLLQKQILAHATRRGKWSIVATQMLASMVKAPRPSRAEAADVLNAVLDGADAVMLSEETAMGDHPVTAVRAMDALTRAAEDAGASAHSPQFGNEMTGFAAGAAGAAVSAAQRIGACAIVTLAGSGLTALLVSKWRPKLPIVALSSTTDTLRRLNLLRGVRPVAIEHQADMEAQVLQADEFLLEANAARPGDVVVVVAAIPLGLGKATNTIRFHRVRARGMPNESVMPSR